jgi:AbiV family abortive infection protein
MTATNPYTPEAAVRIHRDCCENAGRLLVAAERLLDGDAPIANVAFHLATLALEEVAKAGFVLAMSLGDEAGDTDWATKRLDDHEAKLLWALWTPAFGSGAITQQQIEQARELARLIHATRLQAAYVDTAPDADPDLVPSKVIDLDKARWLVGLARARLRLEGPADASAIKPMTDDMRWFLKAISDPDQFRQIFSKGSLEKLAELRGEVRQWVAWLKDLFDKAKAEGHAIVQKELARAQPSGDAAVKPKWRIRIRLHSNTHSVRPKVLTEWNRLASWLQLSAVDKRKHELLLDVTLRASVSAPNLWYAGWGVARQFITALNIGTMGYFWWTLPKDTSRFYERITDLHAPENFELALERNPKLEISWGNRTLNAGELNATAGVFFLMSRMERDDMERVFGAYIAGLTFIGKSDVHFEFCVDASHALAKSLFEGMRHFGHWDGTQEALDAALHTALADALQPVAFAELVPIAKRAFQGTLAERTTMSMEDVGKVKLLCDVFFIKMSRAAVQARAADEAGQASTP